MVMCDPSKGVYMSCCLLYRGNVQSYEIHGAINSLKNTIPFVKWSPTPFKVRHYRHSSRIKRSKSPGCRVVAQLAIASYAVLDETVLNGIISMHFSEFPPCPLPPAPCPLLFLIDIPARYYYSPRIRDHREISVASHCPSMV